VAAVKKIVDLKLEVKDMTVNINYTYLSFPWGSG
jgi:hypothetical protein